MFPCEVERALEQQARFESAAAQPQHFDSGVLAVAMHDDGAVQLAQLDRERREARPGMVQIAAQVEGQVVGSGWRPGE